MESVNDTLPRRFRSAASLEFARAHPPLILSIIDRLTPVLIAGGINCWIVDAGARAPYWRMLSE
jgi:hypothetical protein